MRILFIGGTGNISAECAALLHQRGHEILILSRGRSAVPGGCRAAAVTHVARSVCRRIERDLVALARNADAEGATVLTDAVAYLNRLADFLFVLARFCNRVANVEENVVGKFDVLSR